ncbi:hypothetical protein ASE12_14755 [Aeromicrobium sp. Root236]|nr:hypothetical protein ASE12_14755 [Aeromicrobium sp. Root236]
MRNFAALTAAGLAISCLTMTAAHADTYDVSYAPTRAATFNAAGVVHPTDIAVDPSPAATDDPSKFALAETNTTFSRVTVLRNNPFNSTGYGLADGSILDTSRSGLSGPQGISYDAKGRIWVADSSSATVSVFPKDTSSSSPYTTIGGMKNTGLSSPSDVAVAANGDVYVANINSTSTIRVFGAGRGGDIEPIKTIDSGINNPTSIVIDSKGLIYVANLAGGNGNENIAIYAANTESSTPPIRTITGANTHLHGASSLALDSSDNLYVTNATDGADGSVTVFAPGTSGDAFPIKRLSGGNTGIKYPTGVAVDTNRNVHVVNEYSGNAASEQSVFTFNPLVPLTKPPAARSLKISGSSTSSTRTVSWTAPADNGGTPITKYRVIVKSGTKTLYDRTTTSRSYKLLRSKLKSGTNKVYVYAFNKVGSSPSISKTFTVKK